MRARVGEAEEHGVLRQQRRDRFGIVVGEHAAEARLEVFLEREVEHDVERRLAAFVADVGDAPADELGARLGLRDGERAEVDR